MLEDELKAIVIPTGGNVEEDLQRARKAIEFNRRFNAPYIVSGIGLDINLALEYNAEKLSDKEEIDFHGELLGYMLENTDGIFGIDILSRNSRENLLFTFPEVDSKKYSQIEFPFSKEIEGTYAIVSYPLHLLRFKRIIAKAKERGEISENLEIEYIPTKQSFKQFIYGILAFIKHPELIF